MVLNNIRFSSTVFISLFDPLANISTNLPLLHLRSITAMKNGSLSLLRDLFSVSPDKDFSLSYLCLPSLQDGSSIVGGYSGVCVWQATNHEIISMMLWQGELCHQLSTRNVVCYLCIGLATERRQWCIFFSTERAWWSKSITVYSWQVIQASSRTHIDVSVFTEDLYESPFSDGLKIWNCVMRRMRAVEPKGRRQEKQAALFSNVPTKNTCRGMDEKLKGKHNRVLKKL